MTECGIRFNERHKPWAEGNLVIHDTYADGSQHNENLAIDLCNACTQAMRSGEAVEMDKVSAYPKELTTSQYGRDGTLYDPGYTERQKGNRHPYDPEYVRTLESRLGIGLETGHSWEMNQNRKHDAGYPDVSEGGVPYTQDTIPTESAE